MKYFLLLTCIARFIFTAGPASPENAVVADDSCRLAKIFEMAQLMNQACKPGFSGMLRNFRGDDTTRLDFVHVFEKGELVHSVFYYANGKMEEEYRFKCSSLHGDQKNFYESGRLARIIPYRYGRASGLAKFYDENGILRQEALIAQDSVLSERFFDEKGLLIESSSLAPRSSFNNSIQRKEVR